MTQNNLKQAKIISDDNISTWDNIFEEQSVSKNIDVEGKFLHVTVGTDAHPAEPEYVEEVEQKIKKMIKDNKLNVVVFVTNHDVAITTVV
jgi:hypothetical protein